MKLKIQAIKRKEMPSSFGGGTWNITSVKFEGVNNPQYGFDLSGFGKQADKFKVGDVISGYMSTKTYTKKDGTQGSNQVFNAISAGYVYDLLIKLHPELESGPTPAATSPKNDGWQEEQKTQDIEYPVDEINPEDIPF